MEPLTPCDWNFLAGVALGGFLTAVSIVVGMLNS